MSARKSPDAAARILRDHQAARREYLDQLIERCKSGAADCVTLTNTEALAALHALEDVRAGYDARIYFGIKPTPGPRPTSPGRDKLLAVYFMRLGIEHPQLAPKERYWEVAFATGQNEGRIRKAVSKYGESVASAAREMDTNTLRHAPNNFAKGIVGIRCFASLDVGITYPSASPSREP